MNRWPVGSPFQMKVSNLMIRCAPSIAAIISS